MRQVILAAAFAVTSCALSIAAETDFTKPDLKELGIAFVKPAKDKKTGFLVGGKNETALIKKLSEINGRKIAALEKDMRPGAGSEVGSRLGFLGKDEKLLDMLAEDNDYVVGKLGLTHQELAKHMHIVGAIAVKYGKANAKEAYAFQYHGRRYQVTHTAAKGFQLSPFYDDTKTNVNATLTNEKTGAKLTFSLLVAHMVERYGFYEGHGTPYRVDPRGIVAVFDFLVEKKNP